MYYETVKTPRQLRIQYQESNEAQDALVLEYARQAKTFSSAAVEVALNMLPSSVSRSLNSLKKLGEIEETGNLVMGNL